MDGQLADLSEKLRQCETSKESSATDLNSALEEKNKVIQDLKNQIEQLKAGASKAKSE